LVTKDELLDAVWPETYVSDVVLKVCVREIREVLGDQAKSPQYLETVHRRGYRFIAEVRSFLSVANGRQPAATPDGSWTTDRNPATTFVGREMELAHLHKWLEKTLRGERQVVFVTGEPGIGKTTVVETFLEQASAARPLWIARGQCLEQFGAGEAYLPVLEALSRLCREPGSASLVALLKQYAPTWLVQLPSLVSATDRDTLQREIFGATPERMLREMAEAVEVLTAETPLVLVLEDLHWSDYSTLVLIALLARRPESARLLVIGTYRPTEVILNQHPLKTVKQELRVHGRCEELPLEFLGEAAISEYLVLRFPANQFPTELAAVIHQRTDGNPLFMVNVVNYLVAQRLLVEQEGRWRLAGRLDEITVGVPEGIQQMIEKQIDQLSPEERRLLEAASVAGVEFSASVVAAVLGEETNQIETWCEALARSNQFLQAIAVSESPDGVVTARYCFTHALYQSVWYHRVPQARRIRWHQQIGEHNERIFGPRTREIAAELAMHFEAGRDYRRAVRYLRQAADNAARRYANREAMDCLTRALELIPRLPHDERIREHMAILEQRGLVRRSMGDMQGAAEDFQALAACAHEQGEFEVEVSALLYFGNALLWFDRERSLAAGEQAVKLSRQLKNTLLQAHARSYWGHWYSLVREWRDEDARACAEAVQAARQAGDRTLLSLHVSRYAYFQYAQSAAGTVG
jgi:tetratricopeptide (TPR) repeat protein